MLHFLAGCTAIAGRVHACKRARSTLVRTRKDRMLQANTQLRLGKPRPCAPVHRAVGIGVLWISLGGGLMAGFACGAEARSTERESLLNRCWIEGVAKAGPGELKPVKDARLANLTVPPRTLQPYTPIEAARRGAIRRVVHPAPGIDGRDGRGESSSLIRVDDSEPQRRSRPAGEIPGRGTERPCSWCPFARTGRVSGGCRAWLA